MEKAFCICGREHEWQTGWTAVCACGRILEPQTNAEYETRKDAHNKMLERVAKAMASADDLEPLVRLFRD
jgi:hypothetical protein